MKSVCEKYISGDDVIDMYFLYLFFVQYARTCTISNGNCKAHNPQRFSHAEMAWRSNWLAVQGGGLRQSIADRPPSYAIRQYMYVQYCADNNW